MSSRDHPSPKACSGAGQEDEPNAATYRRWFGRHTLWIAWVGLIIAVVHPPHGLGMPICWGRLATGLPCPGCGLTRSLSCAVRGMFQESFAYHPFGVLVLVFFMLAAVVSVLSKPRRRWLARFMERRSQLAGRLYSWLVGAFVAFGLSRAAMHLLMSAAAGGWPS